MINADMLLTEMEKLSTMGPVVVKQMFTGLLAGVAMCLKDRELCERMERTIRTEWLLTGPTPTYGAGEMADALLRALSRAEET